MGTQSVDLPHDREGRPEVWQRQLSGKGKGQIDKKEFEKWAQETSTVVQKFKANAARNGTMEGTAQESRDVVILTFGALASFFLYRAWRT